MERKLLQIAFALGMPTIGLIISLAGELIFAPLSWLWQEHVAGAAQRSVLTR